MNYSPLKTLLTGLRDGFYTLISLLLVGFLNDYLSNPVDLPLGDVVIPAAVLVVVAGMLRNWLKNKDK